jgi:membrane protein DedA with SNARE-associated domain
MPDELIVYIGQYRYLSIFLLVFLQESGAPNPLPNELLLLFSGYLAFTGILSVPAVVCAAIAGDFLAATVLYITFYYFGHLMLKGKRRWLPDFVMTLRDKCRKFALQKMSGIVIGRLSPFVRGYIAAACGLAHIQPQRYGIAVAGTTVIWSSFYVICGYLLGPYWAYVNNHIVSVKYILVGLLGIFVTVAVLKYFLDKKRRQSAL